MVYGLGFGWLSCFKQKSCQIKDRAKKTAHPFGERFIARESEKNLISSPRSFNKKFIFAATLIICAHTCNLSVTLGTNREKERGSVPACNLLSCLHGYRQRKTRRRTDLLTDHNTLLLQRRHGSPLPLITIFYDGVLFIFQSLCFKQRSCQVKNYAKKSRSPFRGAAFRSASNRVHRLAQWRVIQGAIVFYALNYVSVRLAHDGAHPLGRGEVHRHDAGAAFRHALVERTRAAEVRLRLRECVAQALDLLAEGEHLVLRVRGAGRESDNEVGGGGDRVAHAFDSFFLRWGAPIPWHDS